MSDMKCPFCQQKIMCMDAQDADNNSTWYCPRCIAERNWYAFGNETLWQELIRTRKALDVAIDAIKLAKARLELINNSKFANLNNVLQIQCQCEILKIEKSLEQITAQEQKD